MGVIWTRVPVAACAVAYPVSWVFGMQVTLIGFMLWVGCAGFAAAVARQIWDLRRARGEMREARRLARSSEILESAGYKPDPDPLDLAIWRAEHEALPDYTREEYDHGPGCTDCGWQRVTFMNGTTRWIQRDPEPVPTEPEVLPALADKKGNCGICGGSLKAPAVHSFGSVVYRHDLAESA